MIDSVYRKDKNYYPEVFLEECKHVIKEKKKSKFVTGDINISSDEENSNEGNSIKNFFWENITKFQSLQVPSWNIKKF